ncbi:MAG TPA: hypothetical protein VKR52_12525 [Terracidiphilus sp.]|nr:hypothetical protein [Terracidiphilus sp.]
MKRWLALVLLVACVPSLAQRFPPPTDLPGSPFAIKNTWIIGGIGNWDYLTMDATARRLYIAHGRVVQVVDVEAGTLIGTIDGFTQAHQVLLDGSGQYGYVSDGPGSDVKVFDRVTLQIVASIPTAPGPRGIALDPVSGLLLAVCSGSADETESRPNQPSRPRSSSRGAAAGRSSAYRARSTLTVIDTEKRIPLADIVVAGQLGSTQASGDGKVFVTVENPSAILRVDAAQISAMLQKLRIATAAPRTTDQPLQLDWTGPHSSPDQSSLHFMRLAPACNDPLSLALDSYRQRLFTACSNMVLSVTNSGTGAQVATLPIGPDAQAVAYDPNRGLVFTSNGGGDGSLTIVRQTVTDTYSVIQNLPTRQQARTMALDPSTGNVFLVTVLYGAKTGPPPLNGIGTLTMTAVDSSFQVMVIGD